MCSIQRHCILNTHNKNTNLQRSEGPPLTFDPFSSQKRNFSVIKYKWLLYQWQLGYPFFSYCRGFVLKTQQMFYIVLCTQKSSCNWSFESKEAAAARWNKREGTESWWLPLGDWRAIYRFVNFQVYNVGWSSHVRYIPLNLLHWLIN